MNNKGTQLRNKIKKLEEENQKLRSQITEHNELKSFIKEHQSKIDRCYWDHNNFSNELLNRVCRYITQGHLGPLKKFIRQYLRNTVPESKRREFNEAIEEKESFNQLQGRLAKRRQYQKTFSQLLMQAEMCVDNANGESFTSLFDDIVSHTASGTDALAPYKDIIAAERDIFK